MTLRPGNAETSTNVADLARSAHMNIGGRSARVRTSSKHRMTVATVAIAARAAGWHEWPRRAAGVPLPLESRDDRLSQ